MTNPKSSFKEIAILAARAGDSKKADPVTVFDLAGTSPLADYAVLIVVESAPQLDAVEEEVSVKLKHEGHYCLHKDGTRSKNWKVLDYGGTLVHVYDGKAAEFYAIEKLYEKCKQVEWQEQPAAAPAKAPEKKAEAPVAKPAAKKAPAKKAAPAAKPAAKKTAKKTAPKKAVKKAAPKKAAKKAAPKKAAKKAVKAAGKKTAPGAKKAAVKKSAARKVQGKKTAIKKPAKKAVKKTAKKAAKKK
jgi:ribosome silencing factor RsfS/YbeB/iojap